MQDQNLSYVPPPKQQNPLLKRKPLNLGSSFINYKNADEPFEFDDILHEYQILLILFATDWCNVSKPFVKELKHFYGQVNLQKKRMQIVYVSLDKKFKDGKQTHGTVFNHSDFPWIGIKGDDARVKDLKEFYNITSIPSLILLDSAGQEVMVDCRKDVYNLVEDEAFDKWLKLKKQQDQSTKMNAQ